MSTPYVIVMLSGFVVAVSYGIYIIVNNLIDPFKQAERMRKKLRKNNHIKKFK